MTGTNAEFASTRLIKAMECAELRSQRRQIVVGTSSEAAVSRMIALNVLEPSRLMLGRLGAAHSRRRLRRLEGKNLPLALELNFETFIELLNDDN
jgi:hypothetical protein